ncbi:MAG TPA: hypothetical protein VFS08_02240 [Gemmatimonadaceae bacterium]|nr:hypothetical protein [Gemmatimonadaceae bacterium]
MRRALRRLAIAAAGLVLATTALGAQASPYVPLDDPAYAYVDALLARGLLGELGALERPYPARALLDAALHDLAREGEDHHVRGWLASLRERAARYDPSAARPMSDSAGGVEVAGAIALGGTTQSGRRSELLLADDDPGSFAAGELRLSAATGAVVAAGRYVLDQRWRDDPDYTGFTSGGVAGRVQDGYVAGQWRYGELFVGRLARNWGPPPLAGLQVSDAPFTYDHLYGRLGTGRLRLETIIARLDDAPGTFEPVVQRFLSIHRLAGRWRGLELAATETYVYSGARRGFEPSLANPVAPVLLTHYNDDEEGNVSFAADALLRTRWGSLGAQWMLDDFQFESGTDATDEPPSYGATVTAEGLPLWGAQRWFASYTRVANLAYRTFERGDSYVSRGVGLGRAFSDYDEWRGGLDLALLTSAPLRLYVARRRQGEGDYRRPFPPVEAYDRTPAFLSGDVARVTRVGLRSAGAVRGLAWELDAGYNRVRGEGAPIAAADGSTPLAGSGFAGRLRVMLELGFLQWGGRLR